MKQTVFTTLPQDINSVSSTTLLRLKKSNIEDILEDVK